MLLVRMVRDRLIRVGYWYFLTNTNGNGYNKQYTKCQWLQQTIYNRSGKVIGGGGVSRVMDDGPSMGRDDFILLYDSSYQASEEMSNTSV